MLGMKKADLLTVQLDEDTVFLHPVSSELPSDDPFVRGCVTLTLGSAKRVSRLRIQLRGIGTMHGGGDYRYESEDTLLKVLEIDLEEERLEAGEHQYNFAFIIPSSTAVGERCKYGTVRHTVKAWCEGMGSLRSSITSLAVPCWFIANPSAAGELPQGLEVVVQDFGGEVGPVALHVSSAHLSVSSLVFIRISLLAPPPLDIISVTAFILQSFTVHYDDPKIGIAHPPPQRKLLWYCDQTTPISSDLLAKSSLNRGASIPLAFESRRRDPKPLVELKGGEEWGYSRIGRVPDDDCCRPTTLEGTETRIRVRHKLVAEVRYRMKGGKDSTPGPLRLLQMSTKVTIASCCCVQDSLLLPSYARLPPSATPIPPFHRRCLCNETLTSMVTKHGPALEAVENRRPGTREGDEGVPKLGMPGEGYAERWGAGREGEGVV